MTPEIDLLHREIERLQRINDRMLSTLKFVAGDLNSDIYYETHLIIEATVSEATSRP